MASICDETGHEFVFNRGFFIHTHKCSVCDLEEKCDLDVSCKDVSEWQWRCDLPDIYVEQYEVTYTCKKCGGSFVEHRSSKEDLSCEPT